VIADCRFPNEVAMIKRLGGEVWRVRRGAEPEWYDDAISFNKGMHNIGWAIAKDRLSKMNVHPSEYSWVGSDFDRVLENETTIDALRGLITAH
jgi:hypothetical protein